MTSNFVFFSQGSIIFQRTDFNFDNNADNIHFVVLEFNINTQRPTSGYQANDFIGVESFLNSFSTADYTRFCLSYIFTYRDFDGGVLGLAFVGSNSGFGECMVLWLSACDSHVIIVWVDCWHVIHYTVLLKCNACCDG